MSHKRVLAVLMPAPRPLCVSALELWRWTRAGYSTASHPSVPQREQSTTTVVFFLGGCTYTEIAALRWAGRQNEGVYIREAARRLL